jgi:hypothetical protein
VPQFQTASKVLSQNRQWEERRKQQERDLTLPLSNQRRKIQVGQEREITLPLSNQRRKIQVGILQQERELTLPLSNQRRKIQVGIFVCHTSSLNPRHTKSRTY